MSRFRKKTTLPPGANHRRFFVAIVFLSAVLLNTTCGENGTSGTQWSPDEQFAITERTFLYEDATTAPVNLGISNMAHLVSATGMESIEQNKQRILDALEIFKDKGVNMAFFAEFSLTGYFWNNMSGEDEDDGDPDCWEYMEYGALNHRDESGTYVHRAWLENVKEYLNGPLKYIVFNSIRKNPDAPLDPAGPDNKFMNSTYVICDNFDLDVFFSAEQSPEKEELENNYIYDKTFLPGIEKVYTYTGVNDVLVLGTEWGTYGFTTCYDMCFAQPFQEYFMVDSVQVIVQIASWRATSSRKYYVDGPISVIEVPNYYGYQWDNMILARAMTNQISLIGCNTFGNQNDGNRGDYKFWGGSGLWAPSGVNLAQVSVNDGVSAVRDELLLLYNADLVGMVEAEREDFSYYDDFRYYPSATDPGRIDIYKELDGLRAFTRMESGDM